VRALSVAEYALNSVKLAGITSVAVRGADSVCVITQRSKAPVVSARAVPYW
jgi:20S proteasome alpha/beta subunit